MGKLSGRVAIITGASSGIGRATAELFCEEGAAVVLASRNSERLERVTEQIEQQGGECMAIATDVSKQSDVIHLVQTSLKHFNHVDILLAFLELCNLFTHLKESVCFKRKACCPVAIL